MFLKFSALKIVSVFIFYLALTHAAFAIVNLDGLHFQENEKSFSADIDFKFSGATGNSEYSKAALGGQFSWAKAESINLAMFGYDYGIANDVENINQSFVHLRHIKKIDEGFDIEAFTQFAQNEFTRLTYRGLLGGGVRFKTNNTEKHKAFLGVGAFFDKEEIKKLAGFTDGGVKESVRANIYFLSKYKASSEVSFSNTLYVQPSFENTSDIRVLFQSNLDFKINKTLALRISVDVAHDSEPSDSVKETDVSYLTGFVLNF